jgi:hypothetical protein
LSTDRITLAKRPNAIRRVQTLRGDTLQDVAARALGDASRWYELIYLNELRYPYLTDDPQAERSGVLLTGGEIMVPALTAPVAQTIRSDAYGSDTKLADDGDLAVEGGDLGAVSGAANMTQAIGVRIDTSPGELTYHLDYGCSLRGFIGEQASPHRLTALAMLRRSLKADDRIASVYDASIAINGDSVRMSSSVMTVVGRQVSVEQEVRA